MGLDRSQIWRWESGKVVPSADAIAKLAECLGVTTDYLLGLSDNPIPNMRVDNLSDVEREVLAALRRGDKLAAIDLIASPERS